ncbi:MAG: Arc family DNA-binding protein [Chromohalobacter japonicus]
MWSIIHIMTTQQTDPQYKLRMPAELRDSLKEASKANNRSMNAEIVARLQQSFEVEHREAMYDDVPPKLMLKLLEGFRYQLMEQIKDGTAEPGFPHLDPGYVEIKTGPDEDDSGSKS